MGSPPISALHARKVVAGRAGGHGKAGGNHREQPVRNRAKSVSKGCLAGVAGFGGGGGGVGLGEGEGGLDSILAARGFCCLVSTSRLISSLSVNCIPFLFENPSLATLVNFGNSGTSKGNSLHRWREVLVCEARMRWRVGLILRGVYVRAFGEP
uniref:Uncharacterized protein n=1 Tax=Physcomitrium patens TaxID=3218 RepID=A0A7I3ZR37_PHYPA